MPSRQSVNPQRPVTTGSGTSTVARTAWVIALVWSAVAAYAVWHLTRGGLDWNRDFPILALGAIAFPGAALFLIWRAAIATLRSKKFGESSIELDASPAIAGAPLAGRVRIARGVAAGAKGTFTLQCQQTVKTTTGPTQTRTETEILHETVKPFVVSGDAGRAGIPFRFDVPADARATQSGAQPVEWVLAVDIDGGGIDAKMAFPIEVRRAR